MFKLICVTKNGCYSLVAVDATKAEAMTREELKRVETVSVTRFDEKGLCVGVSVDWSNQQFTAFDIDGNAYDVRDGTAYLRDNPVITYPYSDATFFLSAETSLRARLAQRVEQAKS